MTQAKLSDGQLETLSVGIAFTSLKKKHNVMPNAWRKAWAGTILTSYRQFLASPLLYPGPIFYNGKGSRQRPTFFAKQLAQSFRGCLLPPNGDQTHRNSN